MPRVTVDFSDVQDFEALPKGDYESVLEKATFVEQDDPEKYPYINTEWVVTEEGEFKGRRLWMVLSLSPRALFRMKDVFENLGVYEDNLDFDYDEETGTLLEPEITGLPALLSVSQRTYEGRQQNQIDAVTAIDAPRAGEKKGTAKKTPAKQPAKKAPAKRKFK